MTHELFEAELLKSRDKAKKFLISKFELNSFDAEDVLQIAAIKAYKNIGSFKELSSFETWFFAIAKNEAISLISKRKKSKEIEDSQDLIKNYSSSWVDPEIYRIDTAEEARNFLSKALAVLNKNHKEVLNLMIKKSLSQKEISNKLKIPISSVRTRIFYAKKNLKKIISSYAFSSKS